MSLERDRPELVVITGASAGVGRATAREFAKRGAHIALLARGRDGLEAAAREVEELGGRALILPVDVADSEQIEAAAGEVERRFGPIDIWINNAMVSVLAPVREMTPQEFRRVTEVTYLGQVYGTLAALKRMQTRDRGTIVLVGSALAYRGIPLQSAYCGAKHAVQGFADSLRTELLHEKSEINITMVQLPGLNTPQFDWIKTKLPMKPRPLGRPYQPEIAAEAIYWAAHHPRREVYVAYPTVKAIVGNKIAPWYADRVLADSGFSGQQSDEPVEDERQSNLWAPVAGDHGAHGRFDEESKTFSPQLWATTHRKQLAAALLVGGALLAGLFARREG